MSETVDNKSARQVFRRAAVEAGDQRLLDTQWLGRISAFSQEVERVGIRTYIAMLGTACLAKAVNPRVNVFSLKAGSHHRGSYSARAVATGALVPAAQKARVHLGVTGREPLNNQPFFRLSALDDGALFEIIKTRARPLAEMLLEMLTQIQRDDSGDEARSALRAFVLVRREYWPSYGEFESGQYFMRPTDLHAAIVEFVQAESEGGKRAQAVAAALLSSGLDSRVLCSNRVNDPDRHFPGDLGLLDRETGAVAAAVEVRDKPVSASDILAFAQKCAEADLSTAGLVAAAGVLSDVDEDAIQVSILDFGVEMRVYEGLAELAREALIWSACSHADFLERVHAFGHHFLVKMEVAAATVETWDRVFAPSAS